MNPNEDSPNGGGGEEPTPAQRLAQLIRDNREELVEVLTGRPDPYCGCLECEEARC